MKRASLKYDSSTHRVTVRSFDSRTPTKGDSKVVPFDAIRGIGDADINDRLEEARIFPGREILMPMIQRSINPRGGLRYAS